MGALTSLRLGFATNSSSSHSVVLGGSGINLGTIAEDYNPQLGEDSFGWEVRSHRGKHSIVNYALMALAEDVLYEASEHGEVEGDRASDPELVVAYLAGLTFKNPDTLVLLSKFCRAYPDVWPAYIDHQGKDEVSSQFTEGDWEDQLWEFIATVSEIQTDNDNH